MICRDKDALDAAALGPIVLLGNDWQRRHGLVPLTLPEPMRHGPTVTRRVRIEVEIDAEIEVETERHDGYTGPRGHVTRSVGRVWLADAAAAMKAVEEAVYEQAQEADL